MISSSGQRRAKKHREAVGDGNRIGTAIVVSGCKARGVIGALADVLLRAGDLISVSCCSLLLLLQVAMVVFCG